MRKLLVSLLFLASIAHGQPIVVQGINAVLNAAAPVTPPTQLPAPSLVATPSGSTAIGVNVGTVAGASAYSLEWSATGTGGWTALSTAAGTYNHTGLAASTTYYYRARAIGNGVTTATSAYATASATTAGTGTYAPFAVAWMNAAGIPNDATVYHAGTSQEVTGSMYWTAADVMAQKLSPSLLAKIKLLYVAAGETAISNGVNLKSPGSFNLGYPQGMAFNGYGHQRANSSQYTQPAGFNVLQEMGSGTSDFYIAGYTAGTLFSASAYQSEQGSIRLEDVGSGIFADIPGNLNRVVNASDPAGRADWIDAGASGSSRYLARNGSTLATNNTPGDGFVPNAPFILGNTDAPWSAFVFGRALTATERDTLRGAIVAYLTSLNKHLTPQPVWSAPAAFSVNNALKMGTFTAATGSTEPSNYEFSTNGTTWTPMDESNSRKNLNYSTNLPNGTISFFTGNANIASGALWVRTRAREGRAASGPVVSDAAITYNASFNPQAPGNLQFNDLVGNSRRKFVTFTPGIAAHQQHTSYQVTFDGGATYTATRSREIWTENRSLAPGQFGLRTVSRDSGEISNDGDWIPAVILSQTVFNTEVYNSTALTQVTITGLKPFDATVKASTTAGSNVITLTNGNYGLQPGHYISIGLDGTGTPGGGLRGTRGFVNWPGYRFQNWTAAREAFAANPNAFVNDQYAWIETDEDSAGKYNGYVIRLNKPAGTWNLFFPGNPLRDKAFAANFYTKVVAVNGNQITVDSVPQLTTSNASVWVDNVAIANAQLAAIGDFTEVTFPPGTYPGADKLTLPAKHNCHLKMKGFTLQAIPNERMPRFWAASCNGLRINDYPGVDSFRINDNFAYNYYSPDIARRGETWVWNETPLMPTLDQPINGWGYGKAAMEFLGTGQRVYHVTVKNGTGEVIHPLGNDIVVDGWRVAYDSILVQDFTTNVPYAGGYYWAGYIEGSGIRMKNFTFYSPKWLNAIENFRAFDGGFVNGTVVNGHSSFNTSQGSFFKNVTFNIDSATVYFQGQGTPVVEMNTNFGYNPADTVWRKNTVDNVVINIPKSIASVPEIFPTGFLFVKAGRGVKIINCQYNRGHVSSPYPAWYATAARVQGEGLEIDGLTATGNYGPSTQYNNVWYESAAALSVSMGPRGVPDNCRIANVTVPTIYAPSGATYTNVTATQLPFVPYAAIDGGEAIQFQEGDSISLNAIVTNGGNPLGVTDWQTIAVPEPELCNPAFPNCWATNKVTYTNRPTLNAKAGNLWKTGPYEFRLDVTNHVGLYSQRYVKVYRAQKPPDTTANSFIAKVIRAAQNPTFLFNLPLGANEHDLKLTADSVWQWTTDNKGTSELRKAAYDHLLPFKGIENLVNSEVTVLPDIAGWPYGDIKFPTQEFDGTRWHLWGLLDFIRVVHLTPRMTMDSIFQNPTIADYVGEPSGWTRFDFHVRKKRDGSGYHALYVTDPYPHINRKFRAMRSTDLTTWTEMLPYNGPQATYGHIWDSAGLGLVNIIADADPEIFENPFDGKTYVLGAGFDDEKQRLMIAEANPVTWKAKTPPYNFRTPVLSWETSYDMPRIFNPIVVWLDSTHIAIVYSKNSDNNYGPQATAVIGPIKLNYLLPALFFPARWRRRLRRKKRDKRTFF